MGLVFAAIAAHGSMAIEEACEPQERGLARRTQDAFAILAQRFEAARPDATIVLTPHNVHVDGHFAVVLAGSMTGTLADWDAPAVELTCPVDLGLATEVVVGLHDADLPVVGVSFGANDPGAATAP